MKIRICLSLFCLVCSACATIGGSKQRVKIASNPEGATVSFNGKNIGKTPGFLEIPRGHSGELTIAAQDQTKKSVDLETKYRWGDSFFSNFIWFIWGAPIGWAVDLITGSAWEYKPVTTIRLQNAEPPKKEDISNSEIAIAPPQFDYELLSDEVGENMEKWLKARYPQAHIRPFADTALTFEGFAYDNDHKTIPAYRDDLYYSLGARYIVESKVERTDGEVRIKAEVNDVFTDEAADRFQLDEAATKYRMANRSGMAETLASFLSLIPNDLTFDWTNGSTSMTKTPPDPNTNYRAMAEPGTGILSFISGFGFRNIRSPDIYSGTEFVFHFVPDFSVNYHRLHFDKPNSPSTNELNGLAFDWYTLFLGIGPEVGLDSSLGYFYLQLIPGLGVNMINYQKADAGLSTTSGNINFEFEAGYLFFVSKRVNFRLFGRYMATSASQWASVLSQASGLPVALDSAGYSVGGLSIGYYFPAARDEVKKLLR